MKKLLILFLIFAKYSSSQELKVSVDKNPAIVGEQILIQYTINQKGDNFKSPNFNGLRILSAQTLQLRVHTHLQMVKVKVK